MFMISDFEKSLLLWHKARMLREKSTEVNEAIENINRTIVLSMAGCFSSPDTDDIIKVDEETIWTHIFNPGTLY